MSKTRVFYQLSLLHVPLKYRSHKQPAGLTNTQQVSLLHAPLTKVTQLEVPFAVVQDVGGLDVPVEHPVLQDSGNSNTGIVQLMQVCQMDACAQLLKHPSCLAGRLFLR